MRLALGRLAGASRYLADAMTLYQQVGDRDGQAVVQHCLSAVDYARGRPRSARDRALAALTLARETGDRRTEGAALNALANALRRLGRHREALDRHRDAYRLGIQTATRRLALEALIGLARAHQELGERHDATACAAQALAGARAAGYRILEVGARAVFGGIQSKGWGSSHRGFAAGRAGPTRSCRPAST